MTERTDKSQLESRNLDSWRLKNFTKIFLVVFLTQIPGCLVVCADDAGQIDYLRHEKLIKFSSETFAFPLRLLVGTVDGWTSLISLYIGNLILVSFLVVLISFLWSQVKRRMIKYK